MARRSGLGKGLEALIPPPAKASADPNSLFREIPVGSIQANSRQPRKNFDNEALDSLTESIRVSGVLQPILVREASAGRFELIAGERRWRAATRAGLETVPAVVRTVDDARSLEDALVENLHREDLGPVEEALAYRQLQDEFGLTQEQVAKRVGKSRSAVANALRLLQLPRDILEMADSGLISAGHARALAGLQEVEDQRRLCRAVVEHGMSVRELEEQVRRLNDPSSQAVLEVQEGSTKAQTPSRSVTPSIQAPSASVAEVQELLSEHLDTRVTVSMGAKERGRVILEFSSASDLDRLLRVIIDGRETG